MLSVIEAEKEAEFNRLLTTDIAHLEFKMFLNSCWSSWSVSSSWSAAAPMQSHGEEKWVLELAISVIFFWMVLS